MEEVDKGWMMIRIGEWVSVSSGIGSPGYCRTKGRKTVVVVVGSITVMGFYSKTFSVFLLLHRASAVLTLL